MRPAALVADFDEVLPRLQLGIGPETGAGESGHAQLAAGLTDAGTRQLALFAPPDDPLRARLRDVDVDTLTPLAALQLLDELRRAARAD